MRLFLIRHGQTVRNTHYDLIGQDPMEELSELGIKQAHLLRQRFQEEKVVFKEVYSSPYKRAVDTAYLAIPDLSRLTIVEALREYSPGTAENKSRSALMTDKVMDEMEQLGMHFGWPEGETLFQVEARVAKWLQDVVRKYQDEYINIAAFSHGMTIKTLLHYIMQFDQHMTYRLSISNTSLSILDFKLDHWFIKSINDTSHLPYKEKENNP
jgi:broad specificity phosphatase PhoE